ncbi:MAG: glycosyltransferase family 4 protein [Acidimicrobiales bacterium]|nr:glycosyltransferase family 4 protein [Acidimicrobiales bacterium]
MKHLLVTNDFPPKVGGIQTYLWELWRRLPPDDVTVLTTGYPNAAAWDRNQPYRIERVGRRVLVPSPELARRIDRLADEVQAELIVLDPVVPLGAVSRWLDRPYAVVVHGAEMTIPGRLPGYRALAAGVLSGARLVIAAGGYPKAEAERAARCSLPVVVIPPGVDTKRFHPLAPDERVSARAQFGLDPHGRVILGVSRLVPRKGFDVVIDALSQLAPGRPDLVLAIAGSGRDRARLERRARLRGVPARFLGQVPDDDLPRLYGCADIFAMVCRNRWFGLEQEGFGIVFLEAAACGIPQVAGRSGGSHEAVDDGETGFVIANPRSVPQVAAALGRLLADPGLRARLGERSRTRAAEHFDNDILAARLRVALAQAGSGGHAGVRLAP